MEIHPPEEPVHSFKDFLYHILTVIVGILIALSLEGLLEWRHHRLLISEARSNLASEIHENRRRLTKGLLAAPGAEQRLMATIAAIDAYRKKPGNWPAELDWSYGLFPLNSTAWSTAAATGAVGYMDYPEVGRYTRIYVVQEQFLLLQQRAFEKWLDLQKWVVRTDHGGFANLTAGELAQIEDDAGAALIHTRTEESLARSLMDAYGKTPPEK